MTVRQKLVLFFSISFLFLFAIIAINYFYNIKRENKYIASQNEKIILSSKTAIDLNNEFYKNITIDYTYWDEMQDFNHNPDMEWAEITLGAMIEAYGIDYVWTYDLKTNLQYSAVNEDFTEIENPIPKSTFYQVFDTIQNSSKRFASFYIKKDSFIVAIFGATVHSTEDFDRLEVPTGFFFVGKIIDENYLEKLSTITNCETEIVKSEVENKSEVVNNNIITCKNDLFDWNNEYITSIKFKKTDNFIIEERASKNQLMLIFVVIISLIIFNSVIFTTIEVSNPLKKIKNSLDYNNPVEINKLLKKNNKNEFSQIAKLILLFFKQKQNLETEIEERKAIEEQLKESIEELRQKNEEIHAQTEELYKVNTELEKLSIVASKTNNSVIIANKNLEIEFVNEGFLELYETSIDEWNRFEDKRLDKMKHTENFEKFLANCCNKRNSEVYISLNATFKKSKKWFQTTITTTYDDYGNPEYYIIIETDITFLKEAEEKISLQNKKITYSINYARRIQEALFPPHNLLKQVFSDYFVFYAPKEIISGDFYWVNINNDITYFAVADCTGHGVPGAFMSILSIALLNDIVTFGNLKAAQILEKLREKIIELLHQNQEKSESRDGLDISLTVIDKKNKQIDFAGAHNPLIVINQNGLQEIEADRIPVSNSFKIKPFDNKTIEMHPNNTYYMFSDGFPDQFGEKTNKKYFKANFKKFLLKIFENNFSEQNKLVSEEFHKWKGNLAQVDDVIVFGFKI